MLANFTVTNLDDAPVSAAGDAPGTLRQAIFDANALAGADVVLFAEGLQGMITLTEGELAITDSVSISGPHARQITLRAFDPTPDENIGDGSRIFNIDDEEEEAFLDVKISGLTLTGADSADVGGAIRSLENVLIRESHITGNYSTGPSLAAAGGGVYSAEGELTIENSTISNNETEHDFIALGGGVASNGNLTITGSTISGNVARAPLGLDGGSSYGGGLVIGSGSLAIAHSTIAQNRATASESYGGGLVAAESASITFDHTIVGNNNARTGDDIWTESTVTAKFSIFEDTAGWTLSNAESVILDQDPGISGRLVDHGGATPVYILQPDSPALDAGAPDAMAGVGAVPSSDQRGGPFTRVADGDGDGTATIDIGAYERQTVAGLELVVDTIVDLYNGNLASGDLSLREAVGLANGSLGADTIAFSPLLNSQTILLQYGSLEIVDSVTIDAASQAGVLTIDASGNDPTPDQKIGDGSRVFTIDDEDLDLDALWEISLSGLRLTGGDVLQNGGAIEVDGSLHLSQLTIEGNFAGRSGGAVFLNENDAVLTIDSSTISGNAVAGGNLGNAVGSGFGATGGGALYLRYVSTEITGSTISGNRANGENGGEGGGIVSAFGDLRIRHSTITGNRISGENAQAGNIYFYGSDKILELDHTIVANGSAPSGNDIIRRSGPVIANSSLIEDVSDLTLTGTGNITGLDPNLGPLADHGGPTQTHALLPGSPAIDGGSFAFMPPPDSDQRGGPFMRVFNGDGDTFTIIDIGAYERQTIDELSLMVDIIVDENDGNYGEGDLSLREAVGLANGSIGSDKITFASELVGTSILLEHGEMRIADAVAIDATGLGGVLKIDASGSDITPEAMDGEGTRIFNISDGDDGTFLDVELSGLTLTGGDILDTLGGGAVLSSENLTVNQSTITGNTAFGASFGQSGGPYVTVAGRGGGIVVQSGGTLSLVGSTVDSNLADYGGGIATFDGQLTIISSTISGNQALQEGGGIWVSGDSSMLTTNHSTIAGNRAATLIFSGGGTGSGLNGGEGGGIWAGDVASVDVNHTIVSDNVAVAAADIFSETDVTLFYSLVESGSGFTPSGGPQIIGVDPLLRPLNDNGGPTKTHALGDGSPAIDVGQLGIASAPDFDQRDGPFVRIFDGNNDATPRIDIGAYERQSLPELALLVDTLTDLTNNDYGPGNLSLREAIKLANGSIGDDTITFDLTLSGGTILLLQGEMSVVDSVSIDAGGLPGGVVVDASGNDPTPNEDLGDGSRILTITDQNPANLLDVEMIGLTLTGGDVAGNGGAIFSDEDLTVMHSTIKDSAASFFSNGTLFLFGNGGGISHRAGELVIDSSTISDNSALGTGFGGGIYVFGVDSFTLINSTVSGNSARVRGGALYLGSVNQADLLHSTISNNEALSSGGGVAEPNGALSLNHTIVADNVAPNAADIDGLTVPVVYSLVEDASGFTPDSTFGILGSDPLLGPLADNGGPTQTHALMPGSSAIDTGDFELVSSLDFDQRGTGFARIVDGNSDTFAVIDMGAVEYAPSVSILVGDYNSNGVVDTGDYTVWRDRLDENVTLDNESPTAVTPGVVDQEDYDFWKASFGETLESSRAGISSTQGSDVNSEGRSGESATPVPSTQSIGNSVTPRAAAVDAALAEFASRTRIGRRLNPPSAAPLAAARSHLALADELVLLLDEPRGPAAVIDGGDRPPEDRLAVNDSDDVDYATWPEVT